MVDTSLSDSAREVFTALAGHVTATRPQLAASCGLSKPTVSAAVAELEAGGLVERSGTSHGATGRSAAVYGLGPAAGYALAVDRGSTQVAFRAVSLDGQVLDEGHTDDPASADTMIRAALRRRDASGPLRAVVAAVSDVVSPDGTGDPETVGRVRAAAGSLGLPPGTTVFTENNVNCGAIAELHEGTSDARDTFVYLQVGFGIGAGVVVGGRLLRGANGAAGEVARLAYPWADDRPAGREALEARLGSPGLLHRVRARWSDGQGPVPDSAAALFALAGQAHPLAAELVAEHSVEVGKLAASICAVLDPGLVILGGGVGTNPLLLRGVVDTIDALSWPTEVIASRLGDRATVVGAAHIAREQGIRDAVTAS
jgi:predicted NBD/HSP70 family sugar kinase